MAEGGHTARTTPGVCGNQRQKIPTPVSILIITTEYSLKSALRPEAIESVFIMYGVTGDPVWQEKGGSCSRRSENAPEQFMLTQP